MNAGEAPGASTEGMGAAGYYDAHSEYQRRVIEVGEEWTEAMMTALDLDAVGPALTVVDYGAGTGATSVHALKGAIAAVRKRDAELPVLAIHNDIPTSDFSQLFRNVRGPGSYLELQGGPIYPAAASGSFFAQVLPSGTVHAGMCSNAAHWLRDQPRVRTPDGMYFADATGRARTELAEQAAGDWEAFLTARAAELAPGGHLLVQGIGSTDRHVSASRLLKVMWDVAAGLSDDGLLDRETLDFYVFPAYCRSLDESRPVNGLDVVRSGVDEVSNPYCEIFEHDRDPTAYASTYVEFVRAFAESTMLRHLFEPGAVGIDPQNLSDTFFGRLRDATASNPERGRYEAWIVRVLFVRR